MLTTYYLRVVVVVVVPVVLVVSICAHAVHHGAVAAIRHACNMARAHARAHAFIASYIVLNFCLCFQASAPGDRMSYSCVDEAAASGSRIHTAVATWHTMPGQRIMKLRGCRYPSRLQHGDDDDDDEEE